MQGELQFFKKKRIFLKFPIGETSSLSLSKIKIDSGLTWDQVSFKRLIYIDPNANVISVTALKLHNFPAH
jgi:hypothetical protein